MKLVKQYRRECEWTWKDASNKFWVMELIFSHKKEQVRILIRDLVDWDDKHVIKQARGKALEHFKLKKAYEPSKKKTNTEDNGGNK